MAVKQFSRGRGRLGAPRRLTMWIGGGASNTTLAAPGTSVLVATFNAAALALRPFTIIRTRGILHIKSDQLAANEDQFASYAMAVVSDQAAAIGITAVPTPETDQGSDLFHVFEPLANTFTFLSAVGSHNGGTARVFDSKAMRRVNDDQTCAVVVESGALSSGVIVYDSFRQLIKLH